MFVVLKGDPYGALTWLATLATEAEAREVANETMLKLEETVMVIEAPAFRQNA